MNPKKKKKTPRRRLPFPSSRFDYTNHITPLSISPTANVTTATRYRWADKNTHSDNNNGDGAEMSNTHAKKSRTSSVKKPGCCGQPAACSGSSRPAALASHGVSGKAHYLRRKNYATFDLPELACALKALFCHLSA